MTPRGLLAFVIAAAAAGGGCDNRQAIHAPDPTLARMLVQRRADPYEASAAFANGMTMRTPPQGTVPRDAEDDRAPPRVTRGLLAAGRVGFERICAACHGMTGDSVSVVATKMPRRPPPSLHEDRIRAMSRDEIQTVIARGYGLMPSYAELLFADERWAVASYVKALQLSQRARIADLPPFVRAEFARRTL